MTSMVSLRRWALIVAFSWLGASTGCGGGGGSSGPGGAGAGTVELAWDAATENADGTPLTDLSSYRIYYGRASPFSKESASQVDVLGTSYDVTGLEPGRYTFVVCAVDFAGNESALSNALTVEVP